MTRCRSRIHHTRIFCILLIPLLIITAPRWPENSLPHELMEFWGHLFVSGGVLLRVLAAVYIGGIKNKTMATDGPFSIVRNPLYVGTFFASIGLAMVTASIVVTVIVAVAFCLYYRLTVMHEEASLQERFGDRYRAYTKRVPRWLPALKLWMEPTELTVKPYFIRQAALDGSVFLLMIPLFEGLCELRESGMVPTVLTLP